MAIKMKYIAITINNSFEIPKTYFAIKNNTTPPINAPIIAFSTLKAEKPAIAMKNSAVLLIIINKASTRLFIKRNSISKIIFKGLLMI